MNKEITIAIKILDYWLVDDYKLETNYTIYMLMQIGNKLSLIKKELKDE